MSSSSLKDIHLKKKEGKKEDEIKLSAVLPIFYSRISPNWEQYTFCFANTSFFSVIFVPSNIMWKKVNYFFCFIPWTSKNPLLFFVMNLIICQTKNMYNNNHITIYSYMFVILSKKFSDFVSKKISDYVEHVENQSQDRLKCAFHSNFFRS